MNSHWIRVGYNPRTGVLTKRRKFGNRHREDGQVKAEAEAGVTHL